jgi:hypothetical protein
MERQRSCGARILEPAQKSLRFREPSRIGKDAAFTRQRQAKVGRWQFLRTFARTFFRTSRSMLVRDQLRFSLSRNVEDVIYPTRWCVMLSKTLALTA